VRSSANKGVELSNKDKIILHLCASEFGSDSKPYRDAGYDVRCITKNIGVENYHPPKNIYGIIANPPCTMFSIARGTRAKKPRDLREGMFTVQECLRIIWEAMYDTPITTFTPSLKFWVIENPATGMLKHFLGKPAMIYQPYEFGDNYSKKTALWGKFNEPKRNLPFNVPPKARSVVDMFTPMSERDRDKRTDSRSIASPYFTKAFFDANQ
jgi:hypothetical protein